MTSGIDEILAASAADTDSYGHPPAVLRIGLLGCGVVGSSVARILLQEAEKVSSAAGVKLELARVAVRDPAKIRPVELPPEIVTTDAGAVATDPSVDILIEVIGGLDLPRALIVSALSAGKSVVSANKELLGVEGRRLAQVAEEYETDLFFEAAAGGAIPIVAALRGSLAAEDITRIIGVVNGTTNFVLEQMESGLDLRAAVEAARVRGYAEQDPRADLEGQDAAAKIAILASLAFEGWISVEEVECAGISSLTPEVVVRARSLGYAVRLVAAAERSGGKVSLRVGPALVERDSVIGKVPGAVNAIEVTCTNGGRLVFQGQGAGGDPSASAVIADVVAAARNRALGVRSPLVAQSSSLEPTRAAPLRELELVNGSGLDGILPVVEVE